MKNSNRCPKCGGSDLIKIRETSGGEGNFVQTGFTIFHRVHLTRFLCSGCGFSEDWVESAEDLEKLRQKFGT